MIYDLRLIIYCLASLLLLFPLQGIAQEDDGEIVVNFKDDLSSEEIQKIANKYGIQLVYNSIFSKHEALTRFSKAVLNPDDLQRLLQALATEGVVEYTEPNYLYQAYMVPNDPFYDKQWNMKQVNMPEAWEKATGKGVIVAVIDTGVAYEDYKDKKGTYHRAEDLAHTTFVEGYDFIDDDAHPNDDNGHGTHVAGTIAQSTNNEVGVAGIAYEATIMPLKVLDRFGIGNISDISEAVVYAADHGAQVINLSLGGFFGSKTLRDAMAYANSKGVTIVCAAGNSGRRGVSYPASDPHCIGISALGPDRTLAPYSSYGPEIDLAAPGGDTSKSPTNGILQNTISYMDPTKDGYEYFQGTSMAAPHVVGVAALVISLGVKGPEEVEKLLKTTAVKHTEAGQPHTGEGQLQRVAPMGENWNEKYGAGMLNAAAAVSHLRSDTFTPQTALFPTRFKYLLAGILLVWIYFKLQKEFSWTTGLYRGSKLLPKFLFWLGLLWASSGFFFLKFLPLPGISSRSVNLFAQAFPDLDYFLLGRISDLNPLFHSGLIAVLFIIAFLHTKILSRFAFGFALGLASHLLIDALLSSETVAYIPGDFILDKLWLLLNALFSFWLVYLAGKPS